MPSATLPSAWRRAYHFLGEEPSIRRVGNKSGENRDDEPIAALAFQTPGPPLMAEVHSIRQREQGSNLTLSRFSFPVCFDRGELNLILSVYSRRVIAGDWCDYAMNAGSHESVFAIYKKKSRVPVFRVIKRRSGKAPYALLDSGGQVLRMGAELALVLAPLSRKKKLRLV
jgi:hypothetical protein